MRPVVVLWLTACTNAPAPLGSTSATGETGRATSAPPQTVEALRAALADRQVDSGEGHLRWDLNDGCCARGDCRLANEGSAYAFPAVPPGDDEYIDDRFPDDEGLIAAWRLRPDEGVLYVGPVPPGGAYASFRSYVHDREGPNGRRVLESVNLGDTLNDQVFETNPDGTLLVLVTPHTGLAEAVTAAASEAGWPALNLDVVPDELVRLGRDRLADTLHLTIRVVGFTDEAALAAFRDEGQGRVFRLTPTTRWDADQLPRLPLREAVPQPALDTLTADVDALRQALLDAHPDWGILETELTPREPPRDEPTCWEGCNRDSSYETTLGTQIGEGVRLWVYGVDPARMGRSTWTEIMLAGKGQNDSAGDAGTDDLLGSAAAIDPTSTDDALFAWVFARDCTGLEPYCSELGPECPGLGETELGSVLIRHYVDPVTHTWPPVAGLGVRRAIKFSPPEE